MLSFCSKFVYIHDTDIKPRCPSMTHALIFLNLVGVNAAICRGYYGAANQTCFA